MYNNQQPPQGYQQQNQGSGQQGQYEKNPNGGYLNKSNYGMDSWYGKVEITPELLADIQQKGAVLIQVKDVQVTQYGPCRRVIAKPYVPNVQGQGHGGQPQNAQQAYVDRASAYQPHAPVHQQQAPTAPPPAPVNNFPSDDIPF